LGLRHAVGAGLQIDEAVEPAGVGRGRHAGRIAASVEQGQLDARDRRFALVPDSVAVVVFVDVAGDAGRPGLGEVVAHAVVAALQVDVAQQVGADDDAAGLAAHGAGPGADAQVPAGLGLDHAIHTGQEPLEAVLAGGVGRCRQARGHVPGALPFLEG